MYKYTLWCKFTHLQIVLQETEESLTTGLEKPWAARRKKAGASGGSREAAAGLSAPGCQEARVPNLTPAWGPDGIGKGSTAWWLDLAKDATTDEDTNQRRSQLKLGHTPMTSSSLFWEFFDFFCSAHPQQQKHNDENLRSPRGTMNSAKALFLQRRGFRERLGLKSDSAPWSLWDPSQAL